LIHSVNWIGLLLSGNKIVFYLISLPKKTVASFKMFLSISSWQPLPLTVGSLLARALTCHFRETPDHYYLVRFPLASELSDLDLSTDFALLQLSYIVAQPPS